MQNSNANIRKPGRSRLSEAGWKEPRTGIIPSSAPKACRLIPEEEKHDVKRAAGLVRQQSGVLTV